MSIAILDQTRPLFELLDRLDQELHQALANPSQATTFSMSNTNSVLDMRVMIVDDEPINIKVVRKYLQEAGYKNFSVVTDPTTVMTSIESDRPDALLLDVMMPGISGLELLTQIRARPSMAHLPILILTASAHRETRLQALESGATDFLTKPVDPSELLPRVRNALVMQAFHRRIQDHAIQMEAEVRRRTADLIRSRMEAVYCLARAAEFRDDETGRHVLRVGRYANLLGRRMGLSDSQAQILELAAQLHDVGKMGIADSVLKKPGRLEPLEYETIKRHCGYGKAILEQASDIDQAIIRRHAELGGELLAGSCSPLMQLAARIALTHHEWWDGSGYPLGLAGNDIPLEGRIVAAADVLDALGSKRCYKPALPIDKCLEIMEELRGRQFDPEVLDALKGDRSELINVRIDLADLE
jgi:putative two-component system response regulator